MATGTWPPFPFFSQVSAHSVRLRDFVNWVLFTGLQRTPASTHALANTLDTPPRGGAKSLTALPSGRVGALRVVVNSAPQADDVSATITASVAGVEQSGTLTSASLELHLECKLADVLVGELQLSVQHGPTGSAPITLAAPLCTLQTQPTIELTPELPTLGRVSLSISWAEIEPQLLEQGTLHVRLASGQGLKAVDMGGSSDPFAKLRIGEQQHTSNYVSSNLNPSWNEDFSFAGTLHGLRELEISVMDRNTFTSDKPLGDARVDLLKLVHDETHSVEVPLDTQGTVRLTLAWTVS